ncbi:KU70 [Auxenochlorella protothecoides x Auxenochlorella symbiontica]
MDAFDESLLTDSDGEDDKNALAPASKEQLVFLIQGHESLLELANLEDEEFEGLTWLQIACRVVAAILRQKVIASGADEVACIFFNTKQSVRSTGVGDFIHVLQDLGQPDVERIQQLEAFDVPLFRKEVGLAEDCATGAGLKNALWQTNLWFGPLSGARVSRRIICFAPGAAPAQTGTQVWKGLLRNVEELAGKGVTLQVIPLQRPGSKFGFEAVWQHIFDKMEDKSLSSPSKFGGVPVEPERFGKLQDLKSTVRAKAHQQRSLGQYRMVLGPDLAITVAMYATMQPATKGQAHWVHAVTNAPLTISSALIDNDTGAVLGEMPEADMQAPKLYFPNTKDAHYKYANFPKVYLEPHEIQSVKAAPPHTIRVLGFKSTSCLKEHHQLRSSSFVYPDDSGVPGSSQVFVALHSAMLDQDQVAFGVFARSHSGGLRLVALLPQEALSDEEGIQLAAPGFHVIYLPFADDLRQPEMDRAFTGSQVVEPTAAQVAAADALIAHLQLGEFSSDIIANPHLQRHYQVLEALAMGEEPGEDVMDDTLPDVEAFRAVGPVVRAFREAVTVAEASPSPGSKRKGAPPSSGTHSETFDDDACIRQVQVAAEAGTLGKLPISTLKPWLKAKHLPVSGRKDELVERILQHMS